MKEFKNLTYDQMCRMYLDEDYCRAFLAYKRWKGKPWCPACQYTHVYTLAPGYKYRCANRFCDREFSITSGTIFEKTRVPLRRWFRCIEQYIQHDKGYPAHLLVKTWKVTKSDETAWFIHHRIMELFRVDMDELVRKAGIWEIDITEIGPNLTKMNKRARAKYLNAAGFAHTTPVMVLVNRGGMVYMRVMKDRSKKECERIIKQFVRKDATVYTDGSRSFSGLGKYFKSHQQFNFSAGNHSNYSGGHVNTMNKVCSMLGGMEGTYIKLTRKYLQRYLDEFCFNRNNSNLIIPEKFSVALNNVERLLTLNQLQDG